MPVDDEKLSMLHARIYSKDLVGCDVMSELTYKVGEFKYPLGTLKQNFRTSLQMCLEKKGKKLSMMLVLHLTPVNFGRGSAVLMLLTLRRNR